MRQAINLAMRFLGLKRQKPTTRLGKIVRRFEYSIAALSLVYFFLQLFPQILFFHSIESEGIQIYSTEKTSGDIAPIFTEIQSLVKSSTLSRDNQQFKIFVCNNKWLFAFFPPFSRGSFAVANPISQCIFVADAEVASNESRRFASSHNTRSFVSVIAHEATHVLMRRAFGFWTDRGLPTWIKEGYCEMISTESSYPETAGDILISKGKKDDSMSFRYLTYRRMLEYLFQEKNVTIEELVRNPPSEQVVLSDTRNWMREKILTIETETETDTIRP